MNYTHQPVMLHEVLELLNLKEGDTVLDATIGLGGHAREIIKKIVPGGRLIGLDRDKEAIRMAEENLKDCTGAFKAIHGNFRDIDTLLKDGRIASIDAALLDVGVSSYHMEEADRGFSIKREAKIDMRMDRTQELSAYTIVNRLSQDDLSDILDRYGEERYHRKISRFIIEARSRKPIETTRELAGIVYKAIGPRRGKIDPATRTFQAIRIAVNDELGSLEEGLKKIAPLLVTSGRICVISFHSLEDRLVKNTFKEYAKSGIFKIITKKPMRPAIDEIRANPRSRSAKLRAAEKIK